MMAWRKVAIFIYSTTSLRADKMLKNIGILSVVLGFVAVAAAGPPLRLQRNPTALFDTEDLELKPHAHVLADSDPSRLPQHVKPVSYEIYTVPIIEDGIPDFPQWSAPGAVKIQVVCENVTQRITLHAAEITINTADVRVLDDATNLPLTFSVTPEIENHFYHIDLEANLTVGNTYTIEIARYVAGVRDVTNIDPKVGLYRAQFTDPATNQRQWLATTQFETIGFRYFCPGFDEPLFKANFTLHIARQADLKSWTSTLPLPADQVPAPVITPPAIPDTYVWDHYHTTVKSSSYLLALVVSNFAETLAVSDYRLPVGILGPPHLMSIGGGEYAAGESANVLKTFEELFPTLPYPMDKMHSVAIPRDDFTFGAMENWGLNTYRDSSLLSYPNVTSEATRYSIASILSHELAHQWFGNLVTTYWWSHIWLNEGFATYMSYQGLRHRPDYEAERQIVSDALHRAFRSDAGASSAPVIAEGTKEEVAAMSIFGDMVYRKGGSLIYMMEGFMGKDALFEGLNRYLTDMSYKAAEQNDLFRNLQQSLPENALPVGKTLQGVMETWTLKRGYPLVRVQRNGADGIYLSQERFRSSGNPPPGVDPDELWDVPIAIATADEANSFNDVKPDLWLQSDAALRPYRSETLNTSKWIVVNPNVHGFYRVLYDTHFARLIQNQLESDHTVISAINRGQFINDYFTFADEGLVSIESALAFTKYMAKESDHAAWRPALTPLATLLPHFTGTQPGFYEPFKNYLSPKFEGALDAIGWDQAADEHGVYVLLRASLLDWACTLEHEKCAELANNYTTRWMAKPDENPIPVDLQNVLYCAGVAYGPDAVFDFVYTKYTESLTNNQDINSETVRLASALTCSQSNLKLLELVRGTINGDLIPRQHMRLILEGVGSTSYGRDLVYGVLLDEWRSISEYWSGSPGNPDASIIANVVTALTTYQNSADQVAKVSAIIEKILIEDPVAGFPVFNQLSAAIEKIRTNAVWLRDYGAVIRQWFINNAPSP